MLVYVVTSVRTPMPAMSSSLLPPVVEVFGTSDDAHEGAMEALRRAIDHAVYEKHLSEAEAARWYGAIATAAGEYEQDQVRAEWNRQTVAWPNTEHVHLTHVNLRYDPLREAIQQTRDTMLSEVRDDPDLLANEDALQERLIQDTDSTASMWSNQDLAMMFMSGTADDADMREAAEMAGEDAAVTQVLRIAYLLELQAQVSVDTIREAAEEHDEEEISVHDWPVELRGVPVVLSILNEYVTVDSELLDPLADPDTMIEVDWHPELKQYRLQVEAYVPEGGERLPIAFREPPQEEEEEDEPAPFEGFWRPGLREIFDLIAVIHRRLGALTGNRHQWSVGELEDEPGIYIVYDGPRAVPEHASFRIDVILEDLELPGPSIFAGPEDGYAYEPPPSPRFPPPPPSFIPSPRHRDVGSYAAVRRRLEPRPRRVNVPPPAPALPEDPQWPSGHENVRSALGRLSSQMQVACGLVALGLGYPVYEQHAPPETPDRESYREALDLVRQWLVDPAAVSVAELEEQQRAVGETAFWLGAANMDVEYIAWGVEELLGSMAQDPINPEVRPRVIEWVAEGYGMRAAVNARDAGVTDWQERERIARQQQDAFLRRWWSECRRRLPIRDVHSARITPASAQPGEFLTSSGA